MKKIVVFDLDFTLWNAGGTWCDHTNPPYKIINNHIEDAYGSRIVLYPDVLEIIEYLSSKNITMALASRTGEPSWARELLDLFQIDHFFDYQEIYPGSKIRHFNNIRLQSGIDFENMIFFDDEMRNIHEVATLGVHTQFVENGITLQDINNALNRRNHMI